MNNTLIKQKKQVPWVVKYRPKKLDDIVHQNEIIDILKNSMKTGNLPHLLLYGQQGTGKTSTILAFAYQLFGPKIANQRVIELNASDERGINVVRGKIITFAKTAIGSADPDYPSPPFKLVILDEADAMTTEAQSALRKVMEELSELTRFCFICNFINQIIDPIASRCMKFRFKPIEPKSMTDKLKYICSKENLDIEHKILDKISDISKGDARKAIMVLQNLKYVYDYKKKIDIDDVYSIVGYVKESDINPLLEDSLSSKLSVSRLIDKVNTFYRCGYSITSIMEHIRNYISLNKKIDDTKKCKIIYHLGICEKRLMDGANESLQLLNIFTYIHGVNNNLVDFEPTAFC
jgi:replication factor C subunit 2/4